MIVSKKNMTFLILITYSIFLIISCNRLINQSTGDIQSLVKEFYDMNVLQNYLGDKKKAIVEFFLPTCPHCIEFAPKYEILANIYKDAVNFIKVDCTNVRSFMGLVNIKYFPSLFLYDEGKFFQYDGFFEIEYIHQFIESTFYFKCHKLETNEQLKNFVNENKESNYILGIFKSKEIAEQVLNTFLKLNADMRRLVLNKCYYYVDGKHHFQLGNHFSLMNENHTLVSGLSTEENFIVAYNSRKYNVFDKISNFHSIFPSQNEKVYKNILESYELFLIEYFYPPWEDLEDDMMNTIIARNRKIMIFSALPKEKAMMKQIMEQFILMKPQTTNFDFTILLFELTDEKKNSKLGEMIVKTEIGIYDTNFHLDNYFDEESQYNVETIITTIEEKIKKLAESRENYKNYNSHSANDSPTKYVTAKIVQNLDEDENDQEMSTQNQPDEQDENTFLAKNFEREETDKSHSDNNRIQNEAKILKEKYFEEITENNPKDNSDIKTLISKDRKRLCVWVFYIIIYTIIYVLVYKKYFSPPLAEEAKYN